MPSVKNVELKKSYEERLQSSPNIIMTRYTGLDVEKMGELRQKLRDGGIGYQVVKNNIFKLALNDAVESIEGLPENEFEGPIGVAYAGEDMPAAAKVLKDFGRENEQLEIISGVMDSTYYDKKGVEALAGLPSREELLATVLSSLNSPATKIAGTMQNIMASLARGIKAVGEKNG